MKSIFQIIDERDDTFLRLQPFNVLSNVSMWRNYFALCVVVSAICWIVFGFDSTWSQLTTLVKAIPEVLAGNMTMLEAKAASQAYYGMGNHFSAPVIYGLLYIALSLHLEKLGIHKSENFSITTLLSLSSIGIFELCWNTGYAIFQHQYWTIAFIPKQIYNLTAFSAFTLLGLVATIYMITGNYKLNFSRDTKILFVLTLSLWVLWIFYPFEAQTLTVETSAGIWTSSQMFPQTYYAVDLHPYDGLALGYPHYVEDNIIHFINTLTKVISTWFTLSLFKFKRPT